MRGLSLGAACALLLIFASACTRNDGMGDVWKGVRQCEVLGCR